MYRITKQGQCLEEGLYCEDFDTYEQALDAAIQEACKLLKERINNE